MNKQIDLYTLQGIVTFIVGNQIAINGKEAKTIVEKIEEKGFLKKTVYIYLSNKEILKYNNFQYMLIK
jgi:hypothetical protein